MDRMKPQNKSRITTVALGVAMLLASMGTSITNIALPSLATSFSAPVTAVQAVVVAYLASMTVMVIVAGRMGDLFGTGRMLLAGLAIFEAGALLCALAPGLWWLVGARVLHGIGAAFLITLSMALMRRVADPAHLGRSMGLLGTVSALGTALGPSLGGLLVSQFGWQSIFWLQIPLALLSQMLLFWQLPTERQPIVQASKGLLSGLNRALVPTLLVNAIVANVMMTTLVVGPFYLALKLGLSGAQSGLVMAIGPVISIFIGLPSGWLVDRLGIDRVQVSGLLLLWLGAMLFAFLPNRFGVTGYVIPLLVLAPGYQLFQAANNTAALGNVPPSRQGTVSGLLNLSRNLGLVAGGSLMGLVFTSGVGTDQLAQAQAQGLADGMRLTFLVAALLIALAFAIHVVGKRMKSDPSRGTGGHEALPNQR